MNSWNELSMAEKADIMRIAVSNGITSLQDIRQEYNKFAKGGNKPVTTGGPKSSFIQSLESTPTVLTQLAQYNQQRTEEQQRRIEALKRGIANRGSQLIERRNRDYLTSSNDATQNAATTNQNKHLEERGVEGAKSHAIWEKEHPALSKWGYTLGAAPLAVAATPLAVTAGDALVSTTAGQAITSGLGWIGNAVKATPYIPTALPYADAAITSLFGAHGIQEIGKGNITPESLLEVAPLSRLISPVAEYLIPKAEAQYRAFNTHILKGQEYSDRLRKGINKAEQLLSDLPYASVNNIIRNDKGLFSNSFVTKIQKLRDKTKKYESLREAANRQYQLRYTDKIATENAVHIQNTRGRYMPDFSKMTKEQVEKWLQKNHTFLWSADKYSKLWNDATKRFEMSTAAFNPNDAVTTGTIDLVDAATGKVNTFNLAPIKAGNGITYIFPAGRNSAGNLIEGVSSTGSTTAKAFFPEAPKEYLDAVGKNIDFITQKAVPGSKVFGSSANVRAGNLYHDAHDIDVIMPYSEATKHKDFSAWKEIRPGATFNYSHPTAGPLDVNVIMEDANGNATGALAHELYAQLYPKEYATLMKKTIARGETPSVDIPLDKSSKELFNSYDPVNKSIVDAFSSAKNKHAKRAYYLLNYGKFQDVRKGFDSYMNYVTGGNYKPSEIPLAEFKDPVVNEKLIDALGLKGINKEQFIEDPERMKLLFDYSTGNSSFVGRGISTSNTEAGLDRGEGIIKSATYWYPNTTGGTYMGVGLNTVVGGNSGHGNLYFSLIPNRMKGITEKTVSGALKEIEHNLGKISLGAEEAEKVQNIAKESGVSLDVPIREGNTLGDVLRTTMGRTGQNYKDFIKGLAKEFNIPMITNGKYEGAPYASLLEDQGIENIAQVFSEGIDRPLSIEQRASKLDRPYYGGNSPFSLLVKAANDVEGTMHRNMLHPVLPRSGESLLDKKLNEVRKASSEAKDFEAALSKKQLEKYNRLLHEHYKYEREYNKLKKRVVVGGIGTAAGVVIPNFMPKNRRKPKNRRNSSVITEEYSQAPTVQESEQLPVTATANYSLEGLIRTKNIKEPEFVMNISNLSDNSSIIDNMNMLSGSQFRNGGSIHIAPSKRGTFTAAASKHGMGVQEFANKVLANKENYSPAMVKKANFARNASKWKHGLGGNLFSGDEKDSQQMDKSNSF